MQNNNFDFKKINKWEFKNKIDKTLPFEQQKNQARDLQEYETLEKIEYMKTYFKHLDNSDYVVLKYGKYEVIPERVFNSVYLSKISSKELKARFRIEVDVKSITYELNKPLFFSDKINLCPSMKHKYTKYEQFTQEIKNNVEHCINYLREIWCSDNEEALDYILNWFSNMVKGRKNNTALYLQGPKGIGKSMFNNFIQNHVVGHNLSLETGSEPLKSKFNKILGGKLFVVFEELENNSIGQWYEISAKLKRWITSNTIVLEQKNEKSFTTKNINNYVLLSNHDSIKDDDGRRYFVLDLSTKYKDNFEYFGDFKKKCMNDKIGEAFYCYLMDRDIKNFNSLNFPLTQTKNDKKAERLHNLYEFIKFHYILRNKSILSTVGEFYDHYKTYCNGKAETKITMNKMLKNININYYKSNGYNKYKVSLETLKTIAKKEHWIHDLDEIDVDDDDDDIERFDNERFDERIEKLEEENKIQLETLNIQTKVLGEQSKILEEAHINNSKLKEALELIQLLKNENNELQKMLATVPIEKEPEEDEEDEEYDFDDVIDQIDSLL